jgi:hypothetical protein
MATEGVCHARFRDVREEFERNFAERVEVGASVWVMIEGQMVVDPWGSIAERHTCPTAVNVVRLKG